MKAMVGDTVYVVDYRKWLQRRDVVAMELVVTDVYGSALRCGDWMCPMADVYPTATAAVGSVERREPREGISFGRWDDVVAFGGPIEFTEMFLESRGCPCCGGPVAIEAKVASCAPCSWSAVNRVNDLYDEFPRGRPPEMVAAP